MAPYRAALPWLLAVTIVIPLLSFAEGPRIQMGSRDWAGLGLRGEASAEATAFRDAPTMHVLTLPAPSARELFRRKLVRVANSDSLSFGRDPLELGVDGRLELPSGLQSVVLSVTSPGAAHLRTAWRFADDVRYRVTVLGAGNVPLTNHSGESMNNDPRLVWSAVTSGESQRVLITRDTIATGPWVVSLERVAHFDKEFATSTNFLKGLGDSAYCQQDIACALNGLDAGGQAVVLGASRGVAFMLLTYADGSAATCTGTLLNSAAYPLPIFITANHCTDNAATLDVFWFFSRTGCGTGTISPAVQTTGGAQFVWSSKALDSAVLVLNQLPPAGVSYTGWNGNPITAQTLMLAVHHPRGDLKKGSLGEIIATNASVVSISGYPYAPNSLYMVDWYIGIVEPGSSGSAFFTFNPTGGGMQVRGTLTGGNATCSGIYSRTYYQRFDYIYPYIATALNTPLPPPSGSKVAAIEYHHAGFDHYFITANSDEISKLDSGVFAGWARTGQSFNVYTDDPTGSAGVCRFFSTAFAPKSSHFYTPDANECNIVKGNPNWQFEAVVFNITPADQAGNCPAGASPVYRLYNSGMGAAPNHRYTTSLSIRSQMLAQGWIPEGYGTVGVIMCSPN